jgi:hypothetical protein
MKTQKKWLIRLVEEFKRRHRNKKIPRAMRRAHKRRQKMAIDELEAKLLRLP